MISGRDRPDDTAAIWVAGVNPNSSFVRRAGGQIIITTDVENFRVSLNQSKDLY
ncbi:hypothetical protein [Sinorhizobium meliloti]|uniref:hypothetical protein n=1 Tax=Rhizobium meliloti TaxID=382 RepID=UPI0013E29118|nr:hypothetical protein [Sinorhizobium meliloti]WGI76264.1 hypothetical protein QC756_18765 [Sinorhizobium meliloti]